ncbi:hypothetical protein [uncultured Jannaschia sp.]|uniref:hypothetical protein n=1 Tax=uncultured Jannaschia sp. TaxID=293347 RepID=UPI00260C0376|nr:hypothetical protein [uncultured Jannaschia sp.]
MDRDAEKKRDAGLKPENPGDPGLFQPAFAKELSHLPAGDENLITRRDAITEDQGS